MDRPRPRLLRLALGQARDTLTGGWRDLPALTARVLVPQGQKLVAGRQAVVRQGRSVAATARTRLGSCR